MFNAGFCNSALASKPASNNSGEGAGVLGLDKYPANSAEGAVQQRGQENPSPKAGTRYSHFPYFGYNFLFFIIILVILLLMYSLTTIIYYNYYSLTI